MADYLKRAVAPPAAAGEEVRRAVAEMLADVERRGEDAVRELSRSLDGWEPDSFLVGNEEVEAAAASLPEELKGHIAFAQARVRDFAERQLATLSDLQVETLRGVRLGHRHVPVGAVGAYVPGGRYPMLASAFMTVVVPKVAGVERVVASAPPREGRGIHPAMLYAMASSGADQILCLGGVQALAAMAFGLAEVEPVDMIVGAGNAYVAEAKRQLFGRVGIDLLAGPTEILVLADATADAGLVAADLVGQAEHGPTSPAVLVTTSTELGAAVLAEVRALLAWLPSREVAAAAWRDHGEIVVARDRDEAIEIANRYAHEHVEVHADERELDAYLDGLRNYGSLFLGEEATVAFGDKAVGTNHVLPTAGAARYTGGLWVGKFLKTLTYQWLTEEGMRQIAPAAAAISEAELFPGHALTARMRLERSRPPVGTGA
ncbi:MAG: sulfopropanediol 3-dehydrogenase [Thermoleophilaceae bacterium]|nr:sulfopropanediol 3-dehydrogenase [Thermoleophilaceae bacterium]